MCPRRSPETGSLGRRQTAGDRYAPYAGLTAGPPTLVTGVVVKFPIKLSHGALLRLVGESGEPIPLGSVARLLATGVAVPVGYDGEAYVEDLSSHNELAVERPDGRRCRVVFEYRPVQGDLPLIGPLRCVGQKP